MVFKSTNLIPISSIFVLILIIGGNYLGNIFPCQLQDIMENNVLVKHFLAFLTLVFFVVLADSDNEKNLKDVLKSSILLYLWFILIIRMNAKFFITLVFIIFIIYICKIYKRELVKNKKEKEIENIDKIINILFIISIIITLIGFSIYYFEKRIEYKNKFSNFTFFFGKTDCRKYSPELSIKDVIKEASKSLKR